MISDDKGKVVIDDGFSLDHGTKLEAMLVLCYIRFINPDVLSCSGEVVNQPAHKYTQSRNILDMHANGVLVGIRLNACTELSNSTSNLYSFAKCA